MGCTEPIAVASALLGCEMILSGKQFLGGDSLVTEGVDATIRNIAPWATTACTQPTVKIIRIMLRNPSSRP